MIVSNLRIIMVLQFNSAKTNVVIVLTYVNDVLVLAKNLLLLLVTKGRKRLLKVPGLLLEKPWRSGLLELMVRMLALTL